MEFENMPYTTLNQRKIQRAVNREVKQLNTLFTDHGYDWRIRQTHGWLWKTKTAQGAPKFSCLVCKFRVENTATGQFKEFKNFIWRKPDMREFENEVHYVLENVVFD